MFNPDIINGAFESFGAVLSVMNIRQLWRDKVVRGVYWPATAGFTIWGLWNLYYYPHLGQMWSFTGGLAIVTANSVWLFLLAWFRERN